MHQNPRRDLSLASALEASVAADDRVFICNEGFNTLSVIDPN